MLIAGGSLGSRPVPSAEIANVPSGSSTMPSWSGLSSPGAIASDTTLSVSIRSVPPAIDCETVDAAAPLRVGDPIDFPARVARRETRDAAKRQAHDRVEIAACGGMLNCPASVSVVTSRETSGCLILGRWPRHEATASDVSRTKHRRRTTRISCHFVHQRACTNSESGTIHARRATIDPLDALKAE